MELDIIESSYGAFEITINRNKMLAVATNFKSKIYKQITLQNLLSEPGILIKDDIIQKWEPTESIEQDGNLIFPGPYHEGKTLTDINLNVEILLNLATAFKKILKENIPYTGLYTPGIFIPTEGGILIFPPSLINYISSQLSEKESVDLWQPYNHPDASGELQLAFILGVLAYKLLSDELPYIGSTITEIREKMRTSPPVEIQLLAPGINREIAELISRALSLKETNLSDWLNALESWEKNGVVTELDKQEQLKLKRTAQKKQKKRKNQFVINQFFSRNWKILGITVLVIAAIVSFGIQPIKNALEPPVTAGMSPIEVVSTYYKGITSMDSEIMEDCVAKGIAKDDLGEVLNLFVISKVRTGYEGKSGLISAQDWNDGKVTELDPGDQVYGIADLDISEIAKSVFEVDYIKWYPGIPDDPDSREILPPQKVEVKDLLTLEKIKNVWTIVRMDRQKKELK